MILLDLGLGRSPQEIYQKEKKLLLWESRLSRLLKEGIKIPTHQICLFLKIPTFWVTKTVLGFICLDKGFKSEAIQDNLGSSSSSF